MIFWEDIINIIMDMFCYNQKDIAERLHIHAGYLSNVKHYKRILSISNETIFDSIFSPDSVDPPKRESAQYYLQILKEDILTKPKHVEVRKAMDDCWDEKSYRTFVIKLLNRVQRKPRVDGTDMDTTNAPHQEPPAMQPLVQPHSDRCCVYCMYWKCDGDRSASGILGIPTSGACHVMKGKNLHVLRRRESTSPPCKFYKSDPVMMRHLELKGFNIKDLM